MRLAMILAAIVIAATWWRWIRLSEDLADDCWEPWRDCYVDRLTTEALWAARLAR